MQLGAMESILMQHIVLVEDDLELQSLVKQFLQQQNFAVTVFNDGTTLMSTLATERPTWF